MSNSTQSLVGIIRELLLAAFKAEELYRFCYDRSLFRPIVDRFGPDHGLDKRVDQVIEYCETQCLFDDLLRDVEQANPRQYARFEPQIEEARASIQDSTPSTGRSEPRLRSLEEVTALWQAEIEETTIREQARKLAEEADEKTDDEKPCTDAGLLYCNRLQDYGLAIWWFMESIHRNPSVSYPYDRIAEIFSWLQSYEQAIRWYVRSANADPNNSWPCDRLGELFKDKVKDFDQAIGWFEESIRRQPQGNSIPYDSR